MNRQKENRIISQDNPNTNLPEQVIRDYLVTNSVKRTAEKLKLSVVKVRRILITEGLWTSRSSAVIGRLYARGKTVAQIAQSLCMTEKNVQAYIPYSRGLYNGTSRSISALNCEDYRKRIQIAKERTLKKMEKYEVEEGWKKMNDANINTANMNTAKMNSADMKYKKSDLIRLHLELVTDWWDERTRKEAKRVLREYGEVKYGDTITRDIIAPADMPLYALHYVIQRAFGWQNSHLHHFELPEDRYLAITGDQAGAWMRLIGILFRSPIMDNADRFWADDYEGGSFKTWLRKKYKGPYLSLCHGEGYRQCSKDREHLAGRIGKVRCEWSEDRHGERYLSGAYEIREDVDMSCFARESVMKTEDLSFANIPVRALDFMFENYPGMLLERLPINSLLVLGEGHLIDENHPMADSEELIDSCEQLMEYVQDRVDELDATGIDLPERQPEPAAVTEELLYNYDYGDNWKVKVRGSLYCEDLIEEGRVTREEVEAACKQCRETYRPACIEKDGCNLADDLGGNHGLIEFLRAIHNDVSWDNGPYEDKESSLEWAKGLGWSKRRISARNVL